MTKDPVPLKAVHHIEFWVGNAKQAAYFYRKAFGFDQVAYSGLETGNRDRASYVLEQGRIRMVFSTPLNSNNGISEHIKAHGDGVKDIAFHVDDAKACYEACVARGAKSAREPEVVSDENGSVTKAAIFTYGETIHSFIFNIVTGRAFPDSSKYDELPILVPINPVLFFILNLNIYLNTSGQI